jgi:hypothetical protein
MSIEETANANITNIVGMVNVTMEKQLKHVHRNVQNGAGMESVVQWKLATIALEIVGLVFKRLRVEIAYAREMKTAKHVLETAGHAQRRNIVETISVTMEKIVIRAVPIARNVPKYAATVNVQAQKIVRVVRWIVDHVHLRRFVEMDFVIVNMNPVIHAQVIAGHAKIRVGTASVIA